MKYIPTWCCQNIYTIDFDVLKENHITYILTDLDNTLAPYNVPMADDKIKEYINNFIKEGFKVIIVSNNTGKRVKLFADSLQLEYISGARKPFTSVIKKYLANKKINIEECVIIGDQIMTDIKCANKLGCKSILTTPLSQEESIITFINRKIDQHIRKKYNLSKHTKIDRSAR